MSDDVDDLISDIIRREGGYVNHPDDRGGPTNYGITQATLSEWRRQPVTEFQVTPRRHVLISFNGIGHLEQGVGADWVTFA